MDDHELLIRIDGRVGNIDKQVGELKEETTAIKGLLLVNATRVGNLEGQVKGIWYILGGGGILGIIVAGLMTLVGRKG